MQQYSGPEMNDYGMHVVNLFLLLLGQEFSLILQHSLVCFLHPVTKLVEQGFVFLGATNDDGIMPKSQHYACVVDIYGQAGLC